MANGDEKYVMARQEWYVLQTALWELVCLQKLDQLLQRLGGQLRYQVTCDDAMHADVRKSWHM